VRRQVVGVHELALGALDEDRVADLEAVEVARDLALLVGL
jgi:hypothetical protein